MKIKELIVAGALTLGISLTAHAGSRVIYNQALVNESALAYNNTYPLDLGNSLLFWSNIEQLSMQATYSSSTISAATFTDGRASTMSITVGASFAALHGAQGTNTLYVASTATFSNASFTLNGIKFVQNDLWSRQSLSSNTALSMMNAINNYGATNGTFVASLTGSTVTITCIASGTFCNNFTLATSTPAVIRINATSTTTVDNFSGGVNQGFVVINGVMLTEGTDWFAITTASATAKSISDAIQANASLSPFVSSTWTAAGVVTATATIPGASTNWGVMVSSPAVLTVTNRAFFGGTNSAISTATSRISLPATTLTTALPVLFTKSAGSTPGQLIANTTYYVIKVDANTIKLASSSTNALAGTAIAISTQTPTGGGTFALTPLAITGTPSFKWQSSNDNSNWNDLSVSSVTMSSLSPASTSWDFGSVNYRYIRLNVVAPTTGAINLVVTGVGKSGN